MGNNPQNDASVVNRLFDLITEMPPEARRDLLEELEQRHPENRRRYSRKPWTLAVYCIADMQVFKDAIRNISNGGVFIRTRRELEIGKDILLKFSIPGKNRSVIIGGQVAWKNERGIGVKFDQEADISKITGLID